MSAAQPVLSAADIDRYRRNGILKLAAPEPLRAEAETLLDEMCRWIKHFLGDEVAPHDLPAYLADLAATNRQAVGRLYKVSRRFPAVRRMASHPWLVQLACEGMETPLVSCCHFVNIRIDLPGEDKYLVPPHQDFPYIQGSLNGVTVWMPLMDTPSLLGPPSFVPGSHLDGVMPVREYTLAQSGGSGGRSFAIADAEAAATRDYVGGGIDFGELVFFHTLLLHRSEPNRGNVARLNVQLRFDDALHPESHGRNYPEGLFLGDRLTETYPEYVVHD